MFTSQGTLDINDHKDVSMVLKIFYSFLLIFLIAFYAIVPDTMNKGTLVFLLIVVLICLILFALRKEPYPFLKKNYLKHSTLALIGMVIVFFQMPIDYILGNINSSDLFIWVNTKIVLKTVTLAVIGLISFLIGYLLFFKRRTPKVTRPELPVKTEILNIIAAILLIVYFLTINPLYLAGYYGSASMGQNATYISVIMESVIFASFIQKFRNILLSNVPSLSFGGYFKKIGWPLWLIVGIYLLSVMLSGDRGAIIVFGLLIISGYFFVARKKPSLRFMILFIFVGATFITILGIARNLNRNLTFADKFQKAIKDDNLTKEPSISPQTQELARSFRTLSATVNYVPSRHDFFYGRFQFQEFLQILPFNSFLIPFIYSENGIKYQSSAYYITWILQGDFPMYGEGTSCLADFYLDFGLIGIILGMLLFGYMIRYSEVSMYGGRIPGVLANVFVFVYLVNAIYISRSTVFSFFREIVWIYFALLINKYFFQRIFK